MNKQTIKHSFVSTLPVMAGYMVLGIGFGILLSSKGYAFYWSTLMSLTIYAGSMQYVGVDLLATGASVISTALMTLMVNARHLFYGISMIDSYKDLGLKKLYAIFGLTDETYSLVCGNPALPEGVNRKSYFMLVTLFDQSYWVLGSTIGGIIGNTIKFNSAGIDFSMTALFVVIFIEQWEKAKTHTPALLGLGISVICLIIFGAGNFLIPSMIGISLTLVLLRKRLTKEVQHD